MYATRERRRERQNETVYDSLVATPDDLGTEAAASPISGFIVPANARLAISFNEILDAGELTIEYDGRTISNPALVADQVFYLDWFEVDKELVFESAIAGTFTLYLVRNNGVLASIATGEFT